MSVSNDAVSVTKKDCQALATYRPTKGVKSADYQPGVDVNGHQVAPADLSGGFQYNLPEKVEFDVRVNPVQYGARNAAEAQVSQTSQAINKNAASLAAAQTKSTQLTQQLATLQATQTTLNTQQSNYTAQISAATTQITAATGGSSPTTSQLATRDAEVSAATAQITGSSGYQSVQSQIAANTASINSTNAAITANNATISAAPTTASSLQTQLTTAQGQVAATTGKYDNTSMSVGHVVVNTRTGEATMDGKPLQGGQDTYLADLCRKAGY
ncbi:MAG TPA: hypothetical protein VGG27_13790 [Magnetospirillaceae bacterium]